MGKNDESRDDKEEDARDPCQRRFTETTTALTMRALRPIISSCGMLPFHLLPMLTLTATTAAAAGFGLRTVAGGTAQLLPTAIVARPVLQRLLSGPLMLPRFGAAGDGGYIDASSDDVHASFWRGGRPWTARSS